MIMVHYNIWIDMGGLTMSYTNINKARDFRLFTRTYIYGDTSDVTDLVDFLDMHIGVKAAKYDNNVLYLTINHDIKRTQITSYYDMINKAFLEYINDGYFSTLVERNIIHKSDIDIKSILIELQTGSLPISSIYTASLIKENDDDDILIITL